MKRVALAMLVSAVAPWSAAYPAAAGFATGPDRLDVSELLPPPPPEGSVTHAADRDVYERSRALRGQPAWSLATADAAVAPESFLSHFSCAVGVELSPRNAPQLLTLFSRMRQDYLTLIRPLKQRYRRPRPYVDDARPICVARDAALSESWSYPSGHAMIGWAYALVLAELVPDRSAPILVRGRAIGDGRVVCGVHYVSDVEAGRLLGSALVGQLHASSEFRANVKRAGRELAALRTRQSDQRLGHDVADARGKAARTRAALPSSGSR